jgi:carbon monoxide dehydrogenase subunit G
MKKKIALVVVVASVAVLALVRSKSAQVERVMTMAAPPAEVQARLANLQYWMAWSPWDRPEPDLHRIFEGPVSGAGASYAYWGDDNASAGRLTVVSASADEVRVRYQVEKPVPQATDFAFHLSPDGAGTRVTWTATSGKNLAAQTIDLLASRPPANAAEMDKGLASLKSVAEAAAAVQTYRVERSAKIDAKPEAVAARIADVHDWTDWSPREILDRKMREQHAGPATGPGSTYYWSGNDEVGAGRVTLISAGDGKVEVEMEVRMPSSSSSDHHFTVAPDGNGTLVTWSVTGEKDASGKAFGFFAVPSDEMGSDMEKSLARLGAAVVAEGKVATN